MGVILQREPLEGFTVLAPDLCDGDDVALPQALENLIMRAPSEQGGAG